MIYFTTELLPEKYKGHINHARCNAQLIKFPYSDKLAEALLEVLPHQSARRTSTRSIIA